LDRTKHASSCPKRTGGWTFARPKAGCKRAVPIPPQLIEPLRQHLARQHVDMHVIQRILGHAQVTTTRIYTEPTDPLTREAAGLIGKALWPDASKLQPEMQPEPGG
jgi:hypothetical protein